MNKQHPTPLVPTPATIATEDGAPPRRVLVLQLDPSGCRVCPFRSRARRLDVCTLGGGDGMTERRQVHLAGVPEDRPLSCPLRRAVAVIG